MKIAESAMASMVLTLALSPVALAGTWRQGESRSDAWWYGYDDRQYPSNIWVWLDGNEDGIAECYYFDKDGWLLTDITTPDGYRANADSQWITYDQICHVHSIAATREAVRTVNDKTYRPREAARNHGKDSNFDEDTSKRVGGPESLFMQQTL